MAELIWPNGIFEDEYPVSEGDVVRVLNSNEFNVYAKAETWVLFDERHRQQVQPKRVYNCR